MLVVNHALFFLHAAEDILIFVVLAGCIYETYKIIKYAKQQQQQQHPQHSI
jgi:hypothetical protein